MALRGHRPRGHCRHLHRIRAARQRRTAKPAQVRPSGKSPMIRRWFVLFIALACAAVTRSSFAPATEPLQRRADVEGRLEAEDAKGAVEWRLMTLRGPDGRVAPDGLVRAWTHMQRMRVRAQQMQAARAAQPANAVSPTAWRWLGPGDIGGRVRSIAISPLNSDTIFTGSVAGGIWRTDDGGASWKPVDDFMANLAVSAIVINPRNPSVMYAGTAESTGTTTRFMARASSRAPTTGRGDAAEVGPSGPLRKQHHRGVLG